MENIFIYNMENNNKPLTIEQTEKETGEELVKYFEQKGTPFIIAERKEEEGGKKYYILCHGKLMAYPFDTYKEAKNAIKYHSWDLITALVFLISEIQQTSKCREVNK